MTQAPELSQVHVADLCGPQPFRKDRPVELRIVSRFGDAAYIDNPLDVVHSQKFKERFPCAGRMSNGQYNGHFCRCHTNQVLWSSSLARETVSRGSKLAAVTSSRFRLCPYQNNGPFELFGWRCQYCQARRYPYERTP